MPNEKPQPKVPVKQFTRKDGKVVTIPQKPKPAPEQKPDAQEKPDAKDEEKKETKSDDGEISGLAVVVTVVVALAAGAGAIWGLMKLREPEPQKQAA